MEVNNNTRVTYAMTTEDASGTIEYEKDYEEYIQHIEKELEKASIRAFTITPTKEDSDGTSNG